LTVAERIQMRRTRGWRKPPGAIYVGRPGEFGNPWKGPGAAGEFARFIENRRRNPAAFDGIGYPDRARIRAELRGRDLACWCPLVDERGNPVSCHADLLLALANR